MEIFVVVNLLIKEKYFKMKRFIIIAFAVLPMLLKAQMNFEKGDWASVKAKAKEENKIIFIDFYTTWCGPCKIMDNNVFTLSDVGDFYNSNFVNYKVDAEKGEGITLTKKYNVKAFPTFVFTDAEGNFLHQAVGGFSADELINQGKMALNPNQQMVNLIKDDSYISKEDIPAHLRELKRKFMPYKSKYQAYVNSLTEKELYSLEPFSLLEEIGGGIDSFTYQLVLENQKEFKAAIGKNVVNNYFYRKYLNKAWASWRQGQTYDEVLNEVKDEGYNFAQKIDDNIKFVRQMYDEKDATYQEYIDRARAFIETYGQDDISVYYKPVILNLTTFMLHDQEVKTYLMELLEKMENNDHPNLADAYANIAKSFVDGGQLESALTYYEKTKEKLIRQNEPTDMVDASIAYITERIDVMAKGNWTFNARGFEQYNGMDFKISFVSQTKMGEYDETEVVKIKDGSFAISGNVKTPLPGIWKIYDGQELKQQGSLILEPGVFPLVWNEDEPLVQNGAYNFYAINSWKTSQEYLAAALALRQFDESSDIVKKSSEAEQKRTELINTIDAIKSNYLKIMFAFSTDPFVRAFACYEGELYYGNEGTKRLNLLKELLPNNPVIKMMEYKRAKQNRFQELKDNH
jgi:thiol-disulfide isomerase/thioredoxin